MHGSFLYWRLKEDLGPALTSNRPPRRLRTGTGPMEHNIGHAAAMLTLYFDAVTHLMIRLDSVPLYETKARLLMLPWRAWKPRHASPYPWPSLLLCLGEMSRCRVASVLVGFCPFVQ